ncbi:ATPase AAA [Clostridia bacterium]|nr:ATPase AAA [Clostridia bacterium]
MLNLANTHRPKTIEEIAGQKHILGDGKPLRKILETLKTRQGSGIPNMLFFGPPGVGKTTLANIIAETANMTIHKLNGTSLKTDDVRQVLAEADTLAGIGGVLLYIDEIQYLTKKQQQILLEYTENGKITLIASTTENPYFYVYGAILSRCAVFEFEPLLPSDITPVVSRAFSRAAELAAAGEIPPFTVNDIEDGVCELLARRCGGDVRKAVISAELCVFAAGGGAVTLESAEELTKSCGQRYDRDGDAHYDILSAFQKSIRGSDENAGLHYLARLIAAGDLPSACRRLLVIAAEDVGLADPTVITAVKACVDAAVQLGLPEARIPLAEAVILLCTSPKSNSAVCGIDAAIAALRPAGVPLHLRDAHYGGSAKLGHVGYEYPHDYPNAYVKQQYLPDELKDDVYYNFGDNKRERAAAEYRRRITPATS